MPGDEATLFLLEAENGETLGILLIGNPATLFRRQGTRHSWGSL